MKRTASIRVALNHARAAGNSHEFCQWAKKAGFTMENTLSVEVPLALRSRDWLRYDDPYGRDFDSAVEDLQGVSRALGDGTLDKTTEDRNSVTFFVEYPGGTDQDSAENDLESALLKELRRMSKDDPGLAVLLFGIDGRTRPNLTTEVEVWD
tara:strand:- start:176 stop:631 length:456 start_codon:yes stop_codon:yes gene_type:complete